MQYLAVVYSCIHWTLYKDALNTSHRFNHVFFGTFDKELLQTLKFTSVVELFS